MCVYRIMIPVCLLCVIYFATVFFGGAHLWSQSVLVLSITGLLLAGLWRWLVRNAKTPKNSFEVILDPPSIAGIFFVIWVAVQVIPLPPSILQALSPGAYALWESTRIVGGEPTFSLSLYPFINLNSLGVAVAILFFYWIALYGIKSRRQSVGISIGLLVLGTFESLYGLVQLLPGEHFTLWWKKTVSKGFATGTFIDRNHLAGFLSMLICLGIGYIWALGREEGKAAVRGKRSLYDQVERWGKVFGVRGIIVFLSVALMIAALLSTASRGGTLTLLAGLIFMVGLILARFFKSRNTFILVLMLSVVCMYVSYVASDRVLERFQYFGAGFESRIALAQATCEMGKDYPLAGTGLGTFEFVFPSYQDHRVDALFEYAHNDWVQLFAETGCVGFVIIGCGFLWFMGVSIARWRKRRNPFSVGVGLGGMGALVAISIHSLSEFNLHMPANALLLALIVAIIYIVLNGGIRRDRELVAYEKHVLRVPVWIGVIIVLIATSSGVIMSKQVVQNWRADSLARTFPDSTISFVNPTDEELKKAWTLAPGNATYWAWMAGRVSDDNRFGELSSITSPSKMGGVRSVPPLKKERADIYLLGEGIKRNPIAWWIWRALGWAAFLKQDGDSDYYMSLACKALDRACKLRPFSPQGYLELGTVELAAYTEHKKGVQKSSWKNAFRRALDLNPALSPGVADQLVLYMGEDGAAELKGLLPEDSKSYLRAARYLFREGFWDVGLDILKERELKKEREVETLWAEYRGKGRWSREKREEVLRQITSLDPQHPGVLLAKGKILKALKSQERRVGVLRGLNHLRDTAWALRMFKQQKKGSPVEIAYFQGRIAEEEKNFREAKSQFQKTLSLNSQYFPAWIHLREMLLKTARTAGDQIELERLERKIELFGMDRVVADVWKWEGNYEGFPSWKARFRVARALEGVYIRFSGNREGVWKLVLDGRFVDAWGGKDWKGSKSVSIPAGEHEFRLVYYGRVSKIERKRLPFELEIEFRCRVGFYTRPDAVAYKMPPY